MSGNIKPGNAKITLQGKQIQCVQCRSRTVRSIGKGQYFCAECCTEFKISEDKVTVYSINSDGGLMKIS